MVSAEVLFVGVGISFAYWFDFGLSFAGGAIAWRVPLAFQILFAIFVFILTFGLPESPRWLFSHDRGDEALATLCALFDKEPNDPYILAEITAIREAIVSESTSKNGGTEESSLWNPFKRDDSFRTRYRILLAWGVQVMNQAGDVNLVVYYAPCEYYTHSNQFPSRLRNDADFYKQYLWKTSIWTHALRKLLVAAST